MVELCLYMAAAKVRFLYLLPILVYPGYCWKVIAPALGAGESVSITDTPTIFAVKNLTREDATSTLT